MRAAFLYLLLLPLSVVAQDQLSFTPVRDSDGNSIPEATSVFQDHVGFMWIGSTNGLYRYDGKKTVIYKHDVKDKSSIPSSTIWQITEDTQSRLWVSTRAGVAWLDSARTTFTKIFPAGNNAEHEKKPYTTAILVDRDNQVWFCSDFGLHHFNPQTSQQEIFSIHNFTPYPPNHRGVSAIVDDKNFLWIATTTGLCRFNKTDHTWKNFLCETKDRAELPLQNTSQDIFIESDSVFWVAYWGGGIKQFDPRTGKFKTFVFKSDVTKAEWGTHNIIRHLVPSKQGAARKFWFSSMDRTLGQFNTSDGSFEFVSASNSRGFEVRPVIGVWDIAGLLWVATNSDLYTIDQAQPKFTTVNFDPLAQKKGAPVEWIVTDSSRHMVYSLVSSDEMFTWNYQSNELKKIACPTKANISTLYISPKGDLLIIMDAENIYLNDPQGRAYKTIKSPYGTKVGVAAIDDDHFLIGTFKHGVYRWTKTSDHLEPLLTNNGISLTEKYPSVFALLVARDRKIWIASHHDGLICYDPVTDKVTALNTSPDGVLVPIFYSIKEGDDGRIWAGSSDGLICVKDGTIIKHYTTSDGLPSEAVYRLTSLKNNIWMTTSRGLAHLDLNTDRIVTYSSKDGLINYNLSFTDIGVLPDDRVVVGEFGKIMIMDPNRETPKATPPRTVVTSVRILGKETALLSKTKLSYEENQIGFEFISLDYIAPQLNQYMYKLEGADRTWNNSGNVNLANYAGLSPGHYTFRVKGKNANSDWSDESIYAFVIEPAFWQTLWFRTLIALAVLAIAYSFYRYRINQLLKLQRIRNGIASDLHDDIGSALTTISLFSEAAKQHSLPAGLPIIDQMGSTSRKVMEDMNDIVWAVSPKNDAFKNLVDRMRLFGSQLFNAAQIQFTMTADEDLIEEKLSMAQRKNLFLIYKEAVNNIAKYANASRVEAVIKRTGKGAVLLIRDNGKGFDPKTASNGNGLDNMKLRAQQMSGEISVQSIPGSGTTVQLYFKPTDNGS